MSLPLRKEIDPQLCWSLKTLFLDEGAYHASLEKLSLLVDNFQQKYNTIEKFTTVELIVKALVDYEEILVISDHCLHYSTLSSSVDMDNSEAISRELHYMSLAAKFDSQLSFFPSALKASPVALLEKAKSEQPRYSAYFRKILAEKTHSLSPSEEALLASLSPILELPDTIYNQSKFADMHFPDFTLNAQSYPLSYVLYENHYASSCNTALRRTAFTKFYNVLAKYKNTVATAYFAHVQRDKILADKRGYSSVFDYLLAEQEVSSEHHHNHISVVMRELSVHMRRYAREIKKFHNLDELHYSDLLIGTDNGLMPQITIDKAKQDVLSSLSVLGDDYKNIIAKALGEHRIDFASNEGKSTGGFCASPYQKGGYILMNWNAQQSEVFTLVHELGHLAHFTLAQAKQNYLQNECSLYLVEAPSTCNELLLANYYLKQANEKPDFEHWVISSLLSNTYYHNFVTHFLEAAYQERVYEKVDKGDVLRAEDLSSIYLSVLKEFWGDEVIFDTGSELTWMRQPHYYSGLYSYTYSAGLTLATVVAKKIYDGDTSMITKWLNNLSAGGSYTPLEFAKNLDIDISSSKPLSSAISYIGSLVDRLSELNALIPNK